MKRTSSNAFTLIEMLIVMVVIAILAAMVLGIASFVNGKAARSRAEGEINAMTSALETYKADNGSYVRTSDTDDLDPRTDGDPNTSRYKKASLALYRELSGDKDPEDNPDMKVDTDPATHQPWTIYYNFKPNQLSIDRTNKTVKYIQDPYDFCYGYSTAAAKLDDKYKQDVKDDPTLQRTFTKGYNTAFDMWSTAGVVKSAGAPTDMDAARWIKNW